MGSKGSEELPNGYQKVTSHPLMPGRTLQRVGKAAGDEQESKRKGCEQEVLAREAPKESERGAGEQGCGVAEEAASPGADPDGKRSERGSEKAGVDPERAKVRERA